MGCLFSKPNDAKTTNQTPQAASTETGSNTQKSKPSDKLVEVSDVYIIGEELGRGAFSIVRKGKNKKTGQQVAVKTIEKKIC